MAVRRGFFNTPVNEGWRGRQVMHLAPGHRVHRLPGQGRVAATTACRPVFDGDINLEEEIHKRLAARSATGRNAPNSGASRRRIPSERLWLRAPPPETGPAGL